jgi:small subunit ribosomal protein S19
MSRSTWKGPFIAKSLLKNNNKKSIKIWSRASTISSSFLNKRVLIYTGNCFRSTLIQKEKIGLKFGEFAFTRKRRIKKVIKKIKNKK